MGYECSISLKVSQEYYEYQSAFIHTPLLLTQHEVEREIDIPDVVPVSEVWNVGVVRSFF